MIYGAGGDLSRVPMWKRALVDRVEDRGDRPEAAVGLAQLVVPRRPVGLGGGTAGRGDVPRRLADEVGLEGAKVFLVGHGVTAHIRSGPMIQCGSLAACIRRCVDHVPEWACGSRVPGTASPACPIRTITSLRCRYGSGMSSTSEGKCARRESLVGGWPWITYPIERASLAASASAPVQSPWCRTENPRRR